MDGLTHTKPMLNLLCIVYSKKLAFYNYFPETKSLEKLSFDNY